MARAYSQDLRERVIEAALSGPSLRQAAARFDVGVSTVIGWVGRLRDSGRHTARRQGRPRGLKLDPHKDFLLPLIEAEPDMTIEKMQERLRDDLGVTASTGTIWTFLDRCRLTFKKKTAHASEQDRPDVLKQREDWFEGQLDLDPAKLVFIAETWASTNMAPMYGWAPKGQRLRAGIPHGHWKRTTFIAGLRSTGLTAPMVLDGSINSAGFLDYCEPSSRSDAIAGRYRRRRQSQQPQEQPGSGSDRSSRRHVAFPSGLQPGFQSHRKSVCKTQGAPATSSRAIGRCALENDHAPHPHLHADRMRKFLRRMRI
jgi:transposase